MPRSPNALDLLRQDHRKVLTLFHRFEKTEDENEQRELCDEIVSELTLHTDIEEGVVYPFYRDFPLSQQAEVFFLPKLY